jgi:hypothetical protein
MSERIYIEAQYDSSVNFPPSAKMLKEIPGVGKIFRLPLDCNELVHADNIKVPDFILDATRNGDARRGIKSVLKLNSRQTPYPWLGKANSCFIALDNGEWGPQYMLDTMIEKDHHIRYEDPVLHDYLRIHFNYNEALSVGNSKEVRHCRSLSGHVAPVIVSTKEASQVIMFDAFSGSNVYDQACPEAKILFNVLYSNRIIPLSANCHPITPRGEIITEDPWEE